MVSWGSIIPRRGARGWNRTASTAVLILAASLLGAAPAQGTGSSPTWQDIEQAKGDVASTAALLTELNAALDGLEDEAAALGDAAVQAGAAYRQANAAAADAQARLDRIEAERDMVRSQVAAYKQQAGALAAQAYKTGSTTTELLLLLESPSEATGTVHGMALAQWVGNSVGSSYGEAVAAERVAEQLAQQADSVRRELARQAKAVLQLENEAVLAAAAVNEQAERQHRRADVLYSKLADLNNTTAELEAERRRQREAKESYAAQQDASRRAAESVSQGSSPGAGEGGAGVPARQPPSLPAKETEPRDKPTPRPDSDSKPPSAAVPDPEPTPTSEPAPGPPPTSPPAPGPVQPADPIAVDDPAAAQGYASGQLAAYGWNAAAESLCLINLWNRESGWRTSAYNPYSGAYGIPQALPGHKMAAAGSDWRTSFRTQVNWGLGYIQSRYGSPCAAWQHSEDRGWY